MQNIITWINEQIASVESMLGIEGLTQWVVATGIALLAAFVLLSVRRVAMSYAKKLRGKDKRATRYIRMQPLYKLLLATRKVILVYVAIFMGATYLTLEAEQFKIFEQVLVVLVGLQLGLWIQTTANLWLERYVDKKMTGGDTGAVTTMRALGLIMRIGIWALVLLLVLDNLGVNITALVAGLGVGGIAVALAAQNILGGLFASMTMVADKPFVIGDFVALNNGISGTIEKIGMNTSRIRALSGEQIVAPNSELVKSWVSNYSRITERRVTLAIGVEYDTSEKHMEEIPQIVRKLIDETEDARFDRAHFKTFGASSLDFEIVYWVPKPNMAEFMEVQHNVNMAILKTFNKKGIGFAFPTQTLHVFKEDNS